MNLLAFASTTFPARPLAMARIAVGLAALIKCVLTAGGLIGLSDPQALRVAVFAGAGYPPRAVPVLLVAVWAAAATALLVGWRSRAAAALLTAVVALVLVLDQQLYSNNLYLLGVMALLHSIADSGSVPTVAAGQQPERVPAYPALLMMAMAPIVYVFAGLSKINPEWLSGGVLRGSLGDGTLALPALLRAPEALTGLALATIVIEVFVGVALLMPGFRRIAVLAGALTHLGMVTMLAGPVELVGFALMVGSVYPLYWALSSERGAGVLAR